ncbi:hypothetical protein WEI85_30455 [Actinomycetes bacterium KLBMP 9797]
MPTGRYLESEAAAEGGRAVLEATQDTLGAIGQHAARIRQLIDARPAGGGEEGARFEEAHENVVTALDAVGKLWGLIEELGENVVAGARGTVAEDELASQILAKSSDVRDIPNIPF